METVCGCNLIDCAAGVEILLQWRERETLCSTTLDPLLAAFNIELGDARDSSLSRRLIQSGRNKIVTSNVIFRASPVDAHIWLTSKQSLPDLQWLRWCLNSHGLSEVPTVKIELFHPQVSAEKPQTEHRERGPSYEDNKSLDSRVPVRPDATLGPL